MQYDLLIINHVKLGEIIESYQIGLIECRTSVVIKIATETIQLMQ